MKAKELNEILENHKHWLLKDLENWEKMRADLRGADLRGADLYRADLRGANLCEANLCGANLSEANLRGANLREADLCEADLCGANLRGAYLREADLCGANLRGANLREADLCEADLCGANLRGANLSEADLCGANLRGANLRGAYLCGAENVPFIPMTCPETGSFIGYKKAGGLIVKLEICEDARRSSATGRKCRCDKAKVLSITNLDGTYAKVDKIASSYNPGFIYMIGEIVEEPNFCEDRFNECASGIHFFINRQEAVCY